MWESQFEKLCGLQQIVVSWVICENVSAEVFSLSLSLSLSLSDVAMHLPKLQHSAYVALNTFQWAVLILNVREN